MRALWGVGGKTEEQLHRLGLRTVGDIAHTPERTLQRALGRSLGAHLSALSWGRDDRRVVPDEPDRSIGAEETFGSDIDDPAVIERELRQVREYAPLGPRYLVRVHIIRRESGLKRLLEKLPPVVLVVEIPADLRSRNEQIAATRDKLLDLGLLGFIERVILR